MTGHVGRPLLAARSTAAMSSGPSAGRADLGGSAVLFTDAVIEDAGGMTLTLRPEAADAGAALRDRRVELGLSQQGLAELARCSIGTVRIYEAGHRMTPSMLRRLHRALDSAKRKTPATTPGPREKSGRQARHDQR